jgi:hypothetical protein
MDLAVGNAYFTIEWLNNAIYRRLNSVMLGKITLLINYIT